MDMSVGVVVPVGMAMSVAMGMVGLVGVGGSGNHG